MIERPNLTMKPHSKSITAVAVLFGIDSLILIIGVVLQAFYFFTYPVAPFRLLIVLALCVTFIAATVGVLRRTVWGRFFGSALSTVSLVYMAIQLYLQFPTIRPADSITGIGFYLGLLICFIWLGSPLYVLTRSKNISAFQ